MNKFLASLLAAFILPAGLARAEEEPDFDGAPGQVAKAGEPAAGPVCPNPAPTSANYVDRRITITVGR